MLAALCRRFPFTGSTVWTYASLRLEPSSASQLLTQTSNVPRRNSLQFSQREEDVFHSSEDIGGFIMFV